jgi:hypothetical protein
VPGERTVASRSRSYRVSAFDNGLNLDFFQFGADEGSAAPLVDILGRAFDTILAGPEARALTR